MAGGITPCGWPLAFGGDLQLWTADVCIGGATGGKTSSAAATGDFGGLLGIREPLLPSHIGSGALCILSRGHPGPCKTGATAVIGILRALSGGLH